MFKIGEFSKLTHLTVRALHHYETIELLVPERIDQFTNYRYYSSEQLETVNRIKILQNIGLSLKSIKEVLESSNVDILATYYDLRVSEIQEEMANLQVKQQLIEEYSKRMKEGIFMEKYNVELKTIKERPVMSLRKTISTFNDEGKLWGLLHAELVEQGVKITTPPKGMTLFHDESYKETEVDAEVQSDIIGEYTDTDQVKFFNAPEITIASVIFNGSYDQMPEINQAIGLWIEANNYEISGPMVNIPYVSPAQDSDSKNWVTEAGYVVKEKN